MRPNEVFFHSSRNNLRWFHCWPWTSPRRQWTEDNWASLTKHNRMRICLSVSIMRSIKQQEIYMAISEREIAWDSIINLLLPATGLEKKNNISQYLFNWCNNFLLFPQFARRKAPKGNWKTKIICVFLFGGKWRKSEKKINFSSRLGAFLPAECSRKVNDAIRTTTQKSEVKNRNRKSFGGDKWPL